ncbi:MAG: capsular biosynthesis protein [Clostridium sartagoforme]|nr:capsular biosynthesis protein [Clostridium sartagoforme]
MGDQYMTLEGFLKILRKRLRLILLIITLFTIVSAILSIYVIKPKYEARTKFFIGKESLGEERNYSQNDVIMYQTLMKSYYEIIRTPDILINSIEKSNINLDVEGVLNDLEVIVIADTQILEVKYRSIDSKEAKQLVSNLTNEFINISKEMVPNGNIKILQKVTVSEEAVTPNKKLNILIGAFVGIVIGILLSFLLESFDKTIREKEELEDIIDLPIIGTLPIMSK